MKFLKSIYQPITIVAVFLFSISSQAAGLLTPKGGDFPELKIKEHHVNVSVDGSFITTSIEQVFSNPHSQALEAIYSFPVPKHAAVGEFIYWIDDQPVVGEVVEKKRAREIYEQEKNAGRETALVEKDAFRTFDIHVAPVLPQSDVRIKLVYIQQAYVDSSVGRYVYPLEDGGVDEAKLAFWSRNEVVEEKFSFTMDIRSAYPIEALRLPKHSHANIEKISDAEWRISLGNTITNASQGEEEGTSIQTASELSSHNAAMTLDQDILVYWRLKENLPAGIDLVTYKDGADKRGTFMLTLTPGDDLAKIQHGRDWIFILDVSGSMRGKYASLVEGVRSAITKLPQQDRFKVIAFNNNAQELTGDFQFVNEHSVQQAMRAVANYQPTGGTNLYAGLDRGLKSLDSDRPTGVILVTDGVANVGNTERKHFLKLLENHDVRLFTFIMGNSANRPLLEEMASVSQGFALSVSNSDDIVGKVIQATEKLGYHAMRDIEIKLNGVRTSDVIPTTLSSVYRGEQIVVMGHYFNAGNLNIEMHAEVAGEKKNHRTTLALPEVATTYPEIERLWGYAHVQQLKNEMQYFGEDADTIQAIVDTAVEYGLVTDYTSMIILREEMFEAYDIARNNKDRVAKEHDARAQRGVQQVAQQAQKTQQPMFSGDRPSLGGSGGGGGSSELPMMLLLLVAIYSRFALKRRGE